MSTFSTRVLLNYLHSFAIQYRKKVSSKNSARSSARSKAVVPTMSARTYKSFKLRQIVPFKASPN
eukprot:1989103-Pleurochrysis_carterae.AAC.1